MAVLLLGHEAFAGSAGQARPREGLMAHTFIGYINVPNHGKIRAHIKLYPSLKNVNGKLLSSRALENEAIGFALAEAKGLKVAPNAGLIELTYEQINKPPSWVKKGSNVLAWFSEDVEHPSLGKFLKLEKLNNRRALRKIKAKLKENQKRAAAWAAFDEAIFNTDRNPGNVLTDNTLIDHGSILGSETWTYTQLGMLAPLENPKNLILNYLEEAAEDLPFKNARLHAASEQAKNYAQNQDAVHSLINDTLYDDQPATAKAVIDFLEKRIANANSAKKIGLVA